MYAPRFTHDRITNRQFPTRLSDAGFSRRELSMNDVIDDPECTALDTRSKFYYLPEIHSDALTIG